MLFRSAYPKLREDFAGLLKKLRQGPVLTSVRHPVTGVPTKIHFTERAFGDGLRTMMYRSAATHEIPFLIQKATTGDFAPFAEAALRSTRDIYAGGGMGLHYCITCGEFVSRIRPEEVEPATEGSFLGSWRVKDQMAACKDWPKSELPPDYFKPFRLEVPVLLIAGETDATGPGGKWAKEVKAFMPNAILVLVPGGGHTPENDCTRALRHALFRTGTTNQLDQSCLSKQERPPFKLP